ncbi:hypothetical protein [uncultured Roseobacter sp.]|uniref:hypothetical protein n=1 Tax=uncultured Roseobacter sp. TaxID=114847 RepID=UPI0026236310|nr:hypothetical protein [uncultured Roseobacter sp.]
MAFSDACFSGVILAFGRQNSLTLRKSGWWIQIKGERITLLALLVMYFSGFADQVFPATASDLRESLMVKIIFAAIAATSSGSFTGRACCIIAEPLISALSATDRLAQKAADMPVWQCRSPAGCTAACQHPAIVLTAFQPRSAPHTSQSGRTDPGPGGLCPDCGFPRTEICVHVLPDTT